MNETVRLAEFVAAGQYSDLPDEVVEAVRIYLLDDLASGFSGSHTPWADIVADLARETGVGPCSVFGRSWTTSAAQVALVNGVAVGGFETDHPFTQGSCHPGGAVFPAVLAMGEENHLDGRSFLTAMALGYEALCRIGTAATRAVEDERGFHGPGTNAPLGAAIGAGKALGLSTELLVNAMGIAGSHGSGLLEFFREGAMTKRLHLGRGAQMGVECALLAQRGFTGPSTVLEGDRGFLNVYSPSPRPELLLEDLGERYLLLGVTLKAYPCHISFHAVIDAIQRFRRDQPFDAAAIENVTVVSATRMMEERFGARAPTTLLGAQYSLPWSAALALCRDVEDPSAWTEHDRNDPRIQKLAAGMELREGPTSQRGATAEIALTIGGRQHLLTATDWKGAPTNPYTFGEIATKFRRYAGSQLSPSTAEEIVERVANLEQEADVAGLAGLIRGA